MKNLILKSSSKTDDFMSSHNEPQKHIGTWIPWGIFAPRLLQGIYVDPEEDMFSSCLVLAVCNCMVPFSAWWPYLWSNLEGPWAMFMDIPKIIQ